jgi:hypothetical protein
MSGATVAGTGARFDTAAPARVAVVGAGPLAAEVLRNLGLAGIPASTHHPDRFWETLRLADLQDCYCAVAAGIEPDARRRLVQLSQVAGVALVNVACDADGIVVETFPFGSDAGCACPECDPSPIDPATRNALPDPLATSVAGALAAAASLRCSGHGARKLRIAALDEPGTSAELQRRADCPACARPWRAPRVIRTRNRWTARESLTRDTRQLGSQTVQLSDAIVVACECATCGPVPELATRVNLPAPGRGAGGACPRCGSTSLQVETRDAFSLEELTARFGGRPVPAKFALAEIGGAPVCFDLEAGTARDTPTPA